MIKRIVTKIKHAARKFGYGGLIYYSAKPWSDERQSWILHNANKVGSVRIYQNIKLAPLPYEHGHGYPLHVHGINVPMIREVMKQSGFESVGKRR